MIRKNSLRSSLSSRTTLLLSNLIGLQLILCQGCRWTLTLRSCSDQLQSAKTTLADRLAQLSDIVAHLQDLEDVMMGMLDQQAKVEVVCVLPFQLHGLMSLSQVEFGEQLASIQQHLVSLEHLYNTYTAYETSFNALIIELERRRRYKSAAEEIVRGMTRQLEAMRQGTAIRDLHSCTTTHIYSQKRSLCAKHFAPNTAITCQMIFVHA